MRTAILSFLVLATAALAQEFPTKGPATADPTKNSSTPREYQGCVIRSNGSLMLADQENRDYRLVGNGKSLDSYVGQEVKITAHDVNPNDPSSDERSISDAHAQNLITLSVERIQKLSDRCTSPK
jgi:hypothetical protein